MGLELTEDQLQALTRLSVELLAWNERVNLTAITDPRDIAIRHVLDSLTVVPILASAGGGGFPPPLRGRGGGEGQSAPAVPPERPLGVVDVGSGGGFPGLPITIVLPHLYVTLVDATAKKVAFLDHVVQTLGLANARAIHSTAEELGRAPEHRGAYDAAVARAVGSVATLVELLVPLLRLGGHAILMKTRAALEDEIAAAAPALDALHASVEQVVEADLGDLLPDRALVVIRKTEETTGQFPRRPGVPRRRPLGTVRS